jgi:hypothetical protein
MLVRYFVSVQIIQDTGNDDRTDMYAVANDGTLWVARDTGRGTQVAWQQVTDLPQ